MSNITASDALAALRLPLYRHKSKALIKSDLYPPSMRGQIAKQLPDLPGKWKQPPWLLVRLFFIAFCWFTLGKCNLEELWQDSGLLSYRPKSSLCHVHSGSSPYTLWNDPSLMWSELGLLWLCFFVPLWFLEGLYQYDDQLVDNFMEL
ncbi:hypothetical protein BDR03DRAFT_1093631 [Suillus americanus]|nr:hypothetical protein BDR03DRAFT_1093631 [Suillus americanus]